MSEIEEVKVRAALNVLNEVSGGEYRPTVKGDELKGWIRDVEDGGTMKVYLDADALRALEGAAGDLANALEASHDPE